YADAGLGEYNVRREGDQFRRVSTKAVHITRGPTRVDPHVAPISPAQFHQPVHERGEPSLPLRIILACIQEHADAPHALALLRARHPRPRDRRPTEQRDEVAPLHSITSSARASSMGGISRPSAFAVFRLMTSSNLVGACTGKSATLSPFRMRST